MSGMLSQTRHYCVMTQVAALSSTSSASVTFTLESVTESVMSLSRMVTTKSVTRGPVYIDGPVRSHAARGMG
jgi:hypothetical protein